MSARLDGEAHPVPDEVIDAHLAGCVGCRAWLVRAERLNRTVRIQAVHVPDLTVRILTAARDAGALPSLARPAAPTRWAQLVAPLRVCLGALATLQLVLAVPDLMNSVSHDAHAGREVAACYVALAVGLLIAACYPEQARVFTPVVLTLALCLVAISAVDMLQGVATPGQVAVHVISLAQAMSLWMLARATDPRLQTEDTPGVRHDPSVAGL
jgi:predicted anti-sigma-YlaC factor YlaD